MTELGYPTTVDAMKERLAMILADPSYVTFVADTGRCVIGVAGATLGQYYEKDGTYSQLLVPCRFVGRAGTRRWYSTGRCRRRLGGQEWRTHMSWSTAHCTAAARTVSTNGAGIPGPAFASSNS